MSNETLPEFPTDESTLNQIEHALGGALTYERPDDVRYDSGDEGPWRVGAEFSLTQLLDFMAGAVGRDPNEELIRPACPDLPGWEGAEVVHDTRIHYTPNSVISALIAEVRRLRSLHPEADTT